jgi:hypothetical protein
MSYVLHRLPAVGSLILTQEYLAFAQQVLSSHNKADKQAELTLLLVWGMLQDMQACLKLLCGSSALGDPEAVARLIADKVSAMNIISDGGSASEDLGEVLASASRQPRSCLPRQGSSSKALQSQPYTGS